MPLGFREGHTRPHRACAEGCCEPCSPPKKKGGFSRLGSPLRHTIQRDPDLDLGSKQKADKPDGVMVRKITLSCAPLFLTGLPTLSSYEPEAK